jgi:hypothetical protein
MIADILSQLQEARMPTATAVEKWLAMALIKKMGVLNLPYHCWHTDPKINPSTKHLLWAAILTEDKERFAIVEGIIHTELQTARVGAVQTTRQDQQAAAVRETVSRYVEELLSLPSEPAFRRELAIKVKHFLPAIITDPA